MSFITSLSILHSSHMSLPAYYMLIIYMSLKSVNRTEGASVIQCRDARLHGEAHMLRSQRMTSCCMSPSQVVFLSDTQAS